jgi:hypothetical protein
MRLNYLTDYPPFISAFDWQLTQPTNEPTSAGQNTGWFLVITSDSPSRTFDPRGRREGAGPPNPSRLSLHRTRQGWSLLRRKRGSLFTGNLKALENIDGFVGGVSFGLHTLPSTNLPKANSSYAL